MEALVKKSLFKSLLAIASGMFMCTSNAVVCEASIWQKTLADGTVRSKVMFDDVHVDHYHGVLGRAQQKMVLEQAVFHNARIIAEDRLAYDGSNKDVKKIIDTSFTQSQSECEYSIERIDRVYQSRESEGDNRAWMISQKSYFLNGLIRHCRQKGLSHSNIECRHFYSCSNGGTDCSLLEQIVEFKRVVEKFNKEFARVRQKNNSEGFCAHVLRLLQNIEKNIAIITQSIQSSPNALIKELPDKLKVQWNELLDESVDLNLLSALLDDSQDDFVCAGGSHNRRMEPWLVQLGYSKKCSIEAAPNFLTTYSGAVSFSKAWECLKLVEKFDLQPIFDFLDYERVMQDAKINLIRDRVRLPGDLQPGFDSLNAARFIRNAQKNLIRDRWGIPADSVPSPTADFSSAKITDSNKKDYFASIPISGHSEMLERMRNYKKSLLLDSIMYDVHSQVCKKREPIDNEYHFKDVNIPGRVISASIDGAVIGYVIMCPDVSNKDQLFFLSPVEGKKATIETLFVGPAWRRQGVAHELLKKAVEHLKKSKSNDSVEIRVQAYVSEESRGLDLAGLVKLYQSHGAQIIGENKDRKFLLMNFPARS